MKKNILFCKCRVAYRVAWQYHLRKNSVQLDKILSYPKLENPHIYWKARKYADVSLPIKRGSNPPCFSTKTSVL